jgi:hypothetical protein
MVCARARPVPLLAWRPLSENIPLLHTVRRRAQSRPSTLDDDDQVTGFEIKDASRRGFWLSVSIEYDVVQ